MIHALVPRSVVCTVLVVALTLPSVGPTSVVGARLAMRVGSIPPSTPYTLTAVVTFDELPDGNLPRSFRSTAGRHELVERYMVRDSTHYRVDLDFVLPALDAGTMTVVMNGRRIEAYDSRTGMAVWDILDRSQVPQPTEVYMFWQTLLEYPNPDRPLRQYLTHLTWHAWSASGHVRVVGHTRLLGHPTTVIDLTSPSTRDSGDTRGLGGDARLWVAEDHPVLLRDEEYRLTPASPMARYHYIYRVTHFQLGRVSEQALAYTPRVKAVRSRWIDNMVFIGSDVTSMSSLHTTASMPDVGSFLFRPPTPKDGRGRLYGLRVADLVRDTVRRVDNAFDAFFCRGPCPTDVPPAQYEHARYVYLQERVRIHGLPPGLQRGQLVRQGGCAVRLGSFPGGPRWAALMRGRIAALTTTNALSRADLVRYAFADLCRSSRSRASGVGDGPITVADAQQNRRSPHASPRRPAAATE